MTVHVTIAVDEAAKAALDAWASDRGVPVDAMLAEAVSLYVAEERELQAAIAEGLADIEAGRVLSHEQVVAQFAKRRVSRNVA